MKRMSVPPVNDEAMQRSLRDTRDACRRMQENGKIRGDALERAGKK